MYVHTLLVTFNVFFLCCEEVAYTRERERRERRERERERERASEHVKSLSLVGSIGERTIDYLAGRLF
jgi:hypothetical protein